jgi:putative IMPACT (imprinted ancient) family translation regulator
VTPPRSPAPRHYRTIASETQCEIPKIKGSRFIATAGHFADEAGVAEVIRRLRARFPDANHHCSAWRSADRFRYNDDGEPSGTAGRPILQRIDGRGLDHVFVVVSRIFGGTKLGAGGLVRAYSSAAAAVLDLAPQLEVVPTHRVRVTVAYEHGLSRPDVAFAEQVSQTLVVPHERLDAVLADLKERTAGRAVVVIEGG